MSRISANSTDSVSTRPATDRTVPQSVIPEAVRHSPAHFGVTPQVCVDLNNK